ncbi:MAG: ATP synthase F1 subunit epsilon, partial [Pacificimonas sp.]|nr:ATP synthase F1 subunit epsilon [Pacificimonas sp.]
AQIPGAMGDFTALPGHAPFFSTLRPGMVSIKADGGAQEFFVTGGFAEVSPEVVSLLAEEAVARADLTRDFLTAKLSEAEAALEAAPEDGKAIAGLRVNDYRFALQSLGV